jgi:hypothetical protein
MKAAVVDTNVPVVANGRAEQAGPDCVLACLGVLEAIMSDGRIVLDEGNRILDEYLMNLSRSGQPGAGDMFLKWVLTNQFNTGRCERVPITPKQTDGQSFEEFPDDPDLAGFDPDDRKFVAVAVASRHQPEILNATDTDWWHFREAFRRHGIRIQFLCRQLMARQ